MSLFLKRVKTVISVAIQEIAMIGKFYKQAIICPCRKREVEVTYTISGNWFSPDFKVVACPAMYDDGVVCDRQCIPQLPPPSNYGDFVSRRGSATDTYQREAFVSDGIYRI